MIKGYIYVYSAIVIFSSLEVFSKLATLSVPPLTLWFFRMFFGTLILFPFVNFEKLKKLTKDDWLKLFWLGSVTVGIGVSFFHVGLYYVNASEVAIIFSSNPLFVLLFSKIIYGEKFKLRVYIGMVLGFLGVIVVSYKPGNAFDSLYSLYILFSAILFALYTVLGRKISQKTSSATLNSLSFIFGMFAVMILMLIFHQPFSIPIKDVPYVLYLGVVVTGIAYMLFFKGIKTIGASLGSMSFFVKPWLASFLAFIILGEKFSLLKVLGGLLLALSLILAYWPRKS